MSGELREDELSGDWVIVAPGRRGIGTTRPGGLPPVDRAACPFCPGREAETEATLLAIGDPWEVRVVGNKYPLTPAHEVVIESRDHDADLATYSPGRAAEVLVAIRDRVRVLAAAPGVEAISVFRNRGRRAGSSQPHPHAQIVALPIVPPDLARRAAILERDPDVLARMVERELRDGVRLVDQGEGWIAWCPYASRRAWEVRLAPTTALRRLAELDDVAPLASILVRVVARLRRVLGELDYNVVVRDPPVRAARGALSIDLLPRTGGDAGFEIQTGMGICVVEPAEAAEQLRAAG